LTDNADGASLEQLAMDITGVASDSFFLSHPSQIKQGTKIDVTPLLKLLEMRVRQQVVIAATATKTASFGTIAANGRAGIPNYDLWNMRESEVNNIFDGGSLSPLPRYHCWGMGAVELARGLIKGALKPGEFDKLGLHPMDFGVGGAAEYRVSYPAGLPLANVPSGYLVNFDNNSHYHDYHPAGEMWANEFAIKTGANSYVAWGIFPDRQRTEAEIEQTLCDKYNEGLWWWRKIGMKDVPGYTGTAWFVSIPTLAQKIFNVRTGQTP
jgi:hypothetical protein